MLLLFVVLLLTHQVAGQLQCPQVAASFRGDLNISSFSVSVYRPEGVCGDDRNVSNVDQCKLIITPSVYSYVCMYVLRMHACMYMYGYVCMRAYVCVCVRVRACMRECVRVCMYVCSYMYNIFEAYNWIYPLPLAYSLFSCENTENNGRYP